STAQVWVQADGRGQLADIPLTLTSPEEIDPADKTDQERALTLLRQMAALAMEGRLRHGPPTPLAAYLPEDARKIMDRLMGVGKDFERVELCREELTGCKEE